MSCRIPPSKQDMRKFEFTLESALRWYRQKLSAEQMALQRWLAELMRLDRQMQEIRRRMTEGQERLQSLEVLTGYELQTLARYGEQLQRELDRLRPARAQLTLRVAEQRKRLAASHRRVRVLESLEERRRADWLQEFTREENALASELFLAGRARKDAGLSGPFTEA